MSSRATRLAYAYGPSRIFMLSLSTLDEMLDDETVAAPMSAHTDDAREGTKAFVEKRKPEFKGRLKLAVGVRAREIRLKCPAWWRQRRLGDIDCFIGYGPNMKNAVRTSYPHLCSISGNDARENTVVRFAVIRRDRLGVRIG